MKKVLVGLTALMSLSAFASGEKILNYIPAGYHYSSDCKVEINQSQQFKNVSVTVSKGNNIASFNTLLSGKMIQETAKKNSYSAVVEVIPNDQYTGVRRYFVEILKDAYDARVKVVEKRKFLGFWTTDRSASCDITI